MAAPAEGSFPRVGIIGLGLIGGSIARTLRRVAPATEIRAYDWPDVTSAARAAGVIDVVARAELDLGEVDLLVLAMPIPAIIDALGALGRAGERALVTDVGSTKRQVVAAARTAGLGAFVGGHPIAGRERGGFAESTPDLFTGKRWCLTSDGARPSDLARLGAFVRQLGADPVEVTADAHDRALAYVSHLPQLVSTALMSVAGEAVDGAGLSCAGRGFDDLTRLAGSPSDIWQGIFATNADYVREAAQKLATDLTTFASELEDGAAVDSRFDRAHRQRARGAALKAGPR